MAAIFPIREISSYNRKWCIKARITNKQELRTFDKGMTKGSVFSVDLLDAEGGEIRCSFFNECAQKFVGEIEKGKVYTFANGSVKVANRRYNNLNHQYEIAFSEINADIKPCEDDTAIKAMNWNFMSVRALTNKQPPFTTDLCGTIHQFQSASMIRVKKGTAEEGDVAKRMISVGDQSGHTMDITLWGSLADLPDTFFEKQPTIAMKNVGIRDWGNRTGSLSQKTNFVTDESLPEIQKNMEWWEGSGKNTTFTNITQVQGGGIGGGKTPWSTIADIKLCGQDQIFLSGNDSKYFNTFVRCCNLRTTDRDQKHQFPYYDACPKCNRKVDVTGSCVEHGQVTAAPRYMFSACYADKTDSIWMTGFEDSGKTVFGVGADKLKQAVEQTPPDGFSNLIKSHQFGGMYKAVVRVKPDEYQGERRPKYSAVRVEPIAADVAAEFMYEQIMSTAATNGQVSAYNPSTAVALAA